MLHCIFSAIPTDTEGFPSSVPICFVTVASGVVKADRGNDGKTEFDKGRRRGRGTSSTAPREVGKKSGKRLGGQKRKSGRARVIRKVIRE